MVPSPTLYRLAANREYETIPARVESHPEDVLWIDRYGSTCLHILCQARSNVDDALLRAVRAIVKHRPDVVAWPNVATWTPLHFAVEKRCMSCSYSSLGASSQSNNNSSYARKQQQQQQQRRSILPSTFDSASRSNYASTRDATTVVTNDSSESRRSVVESRRRNSQSSGPMCTSTRLVLLLIEACPSAVSVRTKTGFKNCFKTPFHIACEADADYRVLRAMLSIHPSLAVQPFVTSADVMLLYQHHNAVENPLQLLWRNNHQHYNSSRSNISNHQGHHHHGDKALKEKMALLLEAAHMGTVHRSLDHDGNPPFRLLNGACSVRCPRDYLALVLKDHADQICEKDERGLLPLHYAVRNAEGLESQTYTQFVIDSLLEACPEAAAVKDEHGRLPLHVAVGDVGLTWHKGGVQELALGYTDALRTFDPQSGLVPFLQSAVHAIHSRLHLSTTLELLLAAPEMVQPTQAAQRRQQQEAPPVAQLY